MADQNIELADLVTAKLNDAEAGAGLGVTAKRVYLPVLDRSNLEALNVFVIPAADTNTITTRNSFQADYRIDIGVLKQLTVGEDQSFSNVELDGLMEKMRSVKNWLKAEENRHFVGASGIDYVWHVTEHSPLYNPEHLEEHRQFTSFVTASYRARES